MIYFKQLKYENKETWMNTNLTIYKYDHFNSQPKIFSPQILIDDYASYTSKHKWELTFPSNYCYLFISYAVCWEKKLNCSQLFFYFISLYTIYLFFLSLNFLLEPIFFFHFKCWNPPFYPLSIYHLWKRYEGGKNGNFVRKIKDRLPYILGKIRRLKMKRHMSMWLFMTINVH